MKYLIFFFFFSSVFSIALYAAETGIYLSPQLGIQYNASSEEEYASSLGNKIGILAGKKIGNVALESGIFRSNLNNTYGGAKNFRSEYINDAYFIGLRLFLSESFVFSGGLISHNLNTRVKDKNGNRLKVREEDSSYFSYYLGMGMQHTISKEMDIYWESNIMPISEIDFFQIEALFGIRIYL